MSITRFAVAAGLLVLATACSVSVGGGSVSADDVEAQVQEQFSEQFPVESVDCPEDLPAEVDASIICTMVSEGKSFEVTATTTSVEGDNAEFNVEVTKEL